MKVIKHFLDFFAENPPQFLSDENTKVRVGGKIFDYCDLSSVEKLFTAEVVLKNNLNEWYELNQADKLEFIKNFIDGNFRRDRAERNARKEKLNKARKDSDLQLPDVDYILNNIQPCRILGDVRKEAGFKFLDKHTKLMTDYDYHSVYFVLSRDLDDKAARQFMQNMVHVKLDYEPHNPEPVSKMEDHHNVYLVNEYRAPKWRKLKNVDAKLDDDLRVFFIHLFPDIVCRDFVFCWIYHSLTTRAGTYLYLCGGQGSGKNTLATFLTNIHGFDNSSSVKYGAVKGQFNYFLKNKRFVFLDEHSCRNRQEKDILKYIINDRIQLEGKNRDHEEMDVHASYMIANNSLQAVGLDPMDRRFSVPDINDEDIVKVKGRKFMRGLVEKIKDDTVIAQFVKYLEETYRVPKYFPDEPYQKKRYEEIVLSTSRLGVSNTLKKVLAKEQHEYCYSDEIAEHTRLVKGLRYPSSQDWGNFFRNVKVGGKHLGTMELNDTFIPREEYQPRDAKSKDLV